MKYEISLSTNNGVIKYGNGQIAIKCGSDNRDTRASFSVKFQDWERDAYIFLPACVYDGNKFKKTYCSYPPMYEEQDLGAQPEPVIADIPALNPDGSGKIEVTTGDLSVPCVGIYYRQRKEALFIFCEQECKGKNIGLCVSSGEIEIQYPAVRSRCYRMCRTNEPSRDSGFDGKSGETVTSPLIIKEMKCSHIGELFRIFFENRRTLLSAPAAPWQYTHQLWRILEEHMNEDNFSGEYYAEMSKKWQCGWVGGGMSSLPLLLHGSEISRKRAIKTVDFLTAHISAEGFFYPIVENGEIKDDGFGRSYMKNAALTRKNGDALYFLFKHFRITEPKAQWVEAASRCADAFVRLYQKYGSFGQFVNVETGEMMFGGTTSGASVISALVKAAEYFGKDLYLQVAKDAGKSYYEKFISQGITYGGPGEALCAPDSESCYAMLESTVLLYEATGEEKWLDYAVYTLYQFSSWVMPYAYRFPEKSELAHLKINTVGSVFANAQNKHSAPGICTASGDAIYKLYKYTGRAEFLQLLVEIASFIPQCVSTADRPIYSWDREPKRLGNGWICERVNTSDWEGEACIGGVFCSSCWCESSLLLTYSELIKNNCIEQAIANGSFK